jgi:hypothetical protein
MNGIDKSSNELVRSYLSLALWDITKIASVSAGVEWHPEDRDTILREVNNGLEKLLVRYGEISETTNDKARKLATQVLRYSELPRGEGRTRIHEILMESELSHPVIRELKDLIEPVTMGEKDRTIFQYEVQALLLPMTENGESFA